MKKVLLVLIAIITVTTNEALASDNFNFESDRDSVIYGWNKVVVSVTAYTDTQKDGEQTLYDPNGNVRGRYYYLSGLKHGNQCYFTENGDIYRIDVYDEGVLVATTSWSANMRKNVDRISLS